MLSFVLARRDAGVLFAVLFNDTYTFLVQCENTLAFEMRFAVEQVHLLRLWVVESSVSISHITVCTRHIVLFSILDFPVFQPVAVVSK